MRKRKIHIHFFAYILALLSLCFFAAPTAYADSGLLVTIDAKGRLSSNGELIFREQNIGPGDSGDYTVDITNNYRNAAVVYIESVEVNTTAPTEEFVFDFQGNMGTFSGGVADFSEETSAVLQIPAGSSEALSVGFELLDTAGNAYQGGEYEFVITLRVEMERYIEPSPSTDPSPDPSADPTTDPSTDPSDPSTNPSPVPSTDPGTGDGKPPKTGDDFDLGLWASALFICLMAAVLLLLWARKYKLEISDESNK